MITLLVVYIAAGFIAAVYDAIRFNREFANLDRTVGRMDDGTYRNA